MNKQTQNDNCAKCAQLQKELDRKESGLRLLIDKQRRGEQVHSSDIVQLMSHPIPQ